MKKTITQFYGYSFFRNLSFYSAVLIPFFTTWGHISLPQTQLLQSWSMMWIFLLEVPTGVIADRFGRKYSLILSCVIIALAVLIYGSIPNFQIFLACEFLFALSMSLTSGSDEALVYDTLKEYGKEKESVKVFGRAYFFRLSGVLVASILGGFIAREYGVDAAMRLAAIPFFIAALIAWRIKEPEFRSEGTRLSYVTTLRDGWKYFSNHRTLCLLSFDSVIVASSAYFVFWLYQALLLQIGVPLIWFGVFGALLMLVQMLISSNFKQLEIFFGSTKKMLQFSTLATAASFFLVGMFPSIPTVVVFLLFGGGFGLTRATMMSAYINRYIPSRERATILSFISLFRRLFLAILLPIVALTMTHSLTLPFLFIGFVALTVFFFSPIEKEMFE